MIGSVKGAWLLAIGVVLATTAAASPAAGQLGAQRLVRFGFGGGVSVPVSDAGDALKSGINGQAFVLVNAGGIPLRFNLGYQKFDFEEALAAGAEGESTILSGLAGLSFDLVQGPVVPYVTAGLGVFSLKDEITGGTLDTSTTQTKFGVDGGAGLRLRLGRLEAFAEGRVQNIWTEAGAIDASSIKTIPVTFGVLF
jgi:hypothetical protein